MEKGSGQLCGHTEWLPHSPSRPKTLRLLPLGIEQTAVQAKSITNRPDLLTIHAEFTDNREIFHIGGKNRARIMLSSSDESPLCQAYFDQEASAEGPAESDNPVLRERERIARDLHDNAGQYLVGISMRLKALELHAGDRVFRDSIIDIRSMLSRFGDELRATCSGNRGGIPNATRLVSAIQSLVSEWQGGTGIPVFFEYEVKEGAIFDDDEAEAVFRIVQESLTNVAKHAAAATRVDISLRVGPSRIKLEIADNSTKRRALSGSCCLQSGGKGISGMRDRVSELGGRFWVRHTPGKGARLVAIF